MDNLSRLRTALRRTLEQEDTQGTQELYDALQASAPALRRVGRVPPKNAEERREIEAGHTTHRGKPLAVNADFARQALFLADQLSLSERAATSLLHDVAHTLPNATAVTIIEHAVVELDRRRHASADALLLLLQAARAAGDKGALPVLKRLDIFVKKEILVDKPGQDALALIVLAEIDAKAQTLAQALTARTNATSATAIPNTTGGPGQLSHDVLDGRCKALAVYRRTLSGVLYLLARLGALGGSHVQKLVDWLRSRPHDSSTYHILSALLVALQPPSRTTSASSNPFASSSINTSTDYRKSLLGDRALASHMRSALSPGSAGWSEPALKAALGLQWALFATDARRADAALEHVQGYTTDEVEALVWAGAQGGAFTYLTRLVRRAAPATFEAEEEMGVPVAGEHEAAPEAPEPEFVPVFLDVLDVLVRTLIRHASSELRKIKQRQEDIVLASVRADRSVRFSRSAGPSSTSYPPAHTDGVPPRNDIAALFQLIGALYAALPSERALQFWGAQPLASASDPSSDALAAAVVLETTSPKLPAFVQWSTWSTQAADADALASLCGMLAGLANGPHCAELAYNFVAHGAGEAFSGATGAVGTASSAPAVSWTALFGMLESWATALSAPKPVPPPLPNAFGASSSLSRSQGQQAASLVLGPKDVRLAQAFLRLLASVVSHSVDARKAVAGHGAFRAIPVLVTLLPLGVPLELKGAIFGALAAFCAPGAGSAGTEICRAVWGLMERMEVISLRPAGTSAAGVRGVEVELEEVEAPYRLYPATIPFLRLLATLVHTPRRVRFATRLLDLEPASPLPDQLGAPYRTPGLGPFVAFVVDAVFAQIAQREYMRSSDRWRMNDLCLCFVERCLAAYDLSALLALADSGPLTPELLQPFVTHPGHDVLKRILSNTPLSTLILSYVADGVDGFDRGFAREEPLFHSTIVRVLRIVLRVLEIQDAFLDVLVPLLAELDRTGAASPRSAFTPLDQALSFTPQHAPALAAYAAFPEHPELALLSVQITHRLSRSPAFTDLAAAIERSADSERILAAHVRILDADSAQEIADAEALADDHTGAGAPDPDDSLDLAQATRVAALDLLLDGTAPSLSKPHLAHFLLFGASRAETVEDPQALGAQLAGIHILIETLVDGVPRLDRVRSAEEEEDDALEPLFSTLPALAERQLRILHQLCTHTRTAEFVSRYLRAREDFVARQLAVIPARAPALTINEGEPFVDVGYSDGTRMRTTAPALGAFLRYRALVLELAALELHTQTARGHSRGVPELIRLLFTLDEESDAGTEELVPVLDESFKPFRELGQAHLRIIAQAHALDFDWADSLAVAPVELTLLRGLRLDACMCLDAAGCEVVDQGALLALLASARRTLQQQGRLATQVDADTLSAEVAYVLESCAVENHRRELGHAQETGFAAWRRVLDVALFKAFDQLAPSAREGVLFDVLHVLPRLIRAEHVAPTTRALLAEAVVSCVAKLRDDRAQRAATNDGVADTLPAERLHSLLRALVACVLDPSQGALVRGNLYAALVDYLQLVHEPVASETEPVPIRALSGSGIHSLRKGSLAVLKEVFGRLLNVVAGDALDGAEVWKTVAFVLLDALVEIAGSDLSNAALTTLVRTGMLANFVQAIRRDDQRLQAVLVPDPDDLNALYVYEAQTSLLVRIAQSRQGAERLQELQVLPVLSRAEYIDSRPESMLSPEDDAGFVPPALSRYHQLLMPALQVVSNMLGSLGPTHVTAGNQALEFFVSHRDTIAVLLKANSDPTSLMALREVRLIVHICTMLLPRIPKSELASSITGFGSIHAAILGVASMVLKNGMSTTDFQPQSEAEYMDSQTADLDGSSTRFDAAVQTAKVTLHQALATYLGVASEFTEPELCLVLSPDTSIASDRTTRWAGVPSVVDAVHALEEVGRHLAGTFMRLAELSAELSSGSRDDAMLGHSLALVREQDAQQRRALVSTQLSQLHQRTLSEAKTLANTLETVLLLLWRHLVVYVEKGEGISLSVPTSFSQSTRGVVNYDKTVFQNEVVRQMQAALHPLSGLLVDEDEPTWRAHATYIDFMTQRLRDVLEIS